MLHKPTRREVRTGAGGLVFFSGSALLILLTTEPPPSKYYPWWAFVLAGAGVIGGLAVLVATFLGPSPRTEASVDEQLRRIGDSLEELLRTRPFVTEWQIGQETDASPEMIAQAIRDVNAKGKIIVQGQVIRGKTFEAHPEFPGGEIIQPARGNSVTLTSHDPVTRREIVYDPETGRVAGKETVRESGRRDAIAMPETVAVGTNITSPGAPTEEPDKPLPSAPSFTTDEQGRVIVNVELEYLANFYRNNLSIQAERLAEPFIGKWKEVSGIVGNVSVLAAGELYSVYLQNKLEDVDPNLYFDGDWAEQLDLLKRGDHIKVLGQIQKIRAGYVDLEHCELRP